MRELSPEERQRKIEGGRKGGLAKVKKGFAMNPELAKKAGKKGLESRYRDKHET